MRWRDHETKDVYMAYVAPIGEFYTKVKADNVDGQRWAPYEGDPTKQDFRPHHVDLTDPDFTDPRIYANGENTE